MDAQSAVDVCRSAIWLALITSSPILIAGTAIGLFIGLFQALTQIQEQTIAIVLKIVIMVFMVAVTMPWMAEHMIDFTRYIISTVPERLM